MFGKTLKVYETSRVSNDGIVFQKKTEKRVVLGIQRGKIQNKTAPFEEDQRRQEP